MMFESNGEESILSGEGLFGSGSSEYTIEEMKEKLRERIKNNPKLKEKFKNKEILEKLGIE